MPSTDPALVSRSQPLLVGGASAVLISVLILSIGLAGLASDFFALPQPRIFNVHLLFGMVLAWAVAAHLLERRRVLTSDGPASFYDYTRRVSRWVYILLYVMAGVRMGLHLGVPADHSVEDFQIYVIYGVLPLWFIRSYLLATNRTMPLKPAARVTASP